MQSSFFFNLIIWLFIKTIFIVLGEIYHGLDRQINLPGSGPPK